MEITNFKIEKLFGTEDYSIDIKDNRLIIVAENGSGKTTIVNILYFFLSNQWHRLIRYNFKKVSAIISGEEFSLERNEIDIDFEKISKKFLRHFSPRIRLQIEPLIASGELFEMRNNPQLLNSISIKYDIPRHILFRIIDEYEPDLFSIAQKNEEKKAKQKIPNGIQILFLPTYRRIEQELSLIVKEDEIDLGAHENQRRRSNGEYKQINSFIEIVEFGMRDVENLFNSKLNSLESNLNIQLKNNLSGTFLRDIINNQYNQISEKEISKFNEEALNNILERMDNSVLSSLEKEQIRGFLSHLKKGFDPKDNDAAIKAYFIYRLLAIYNELKKEEEEINNLLSILHTYIKNKFFYYNTNKFSISVHPVVNKEPDLTKTIRFMDLSSGEKQIVSLFSHIYLSDNKKYFVIIDEPELSLSVPWQQRFLVDIINGGYCAGLIAVTHSPFIFQNELENHTHSLSEFNKKSV